jgi:hypothetical protein
LFATLKIPCKSCKNICSGSRNMIGSVYYPSTRTMLLLQTEECSSLLSAALRQTIILSLSSERCMDHPTHARLVETPRAAAGSSVRDLLNAWSPSRFACCVTQSSLCTLWARSSSVGFSALAEETSHAILQLSSNSF